MPDTKNLQLKVEDVSCTEAWLRLTSSPAYYGKNLKLLRGDSLIISKPLTANDTLLYDRGLWPNSPYTYRARVYDGGRVLSQSPNVTATTLDTTSHDFTWQTYEFGGQGGSSAFYDVSIISPTDIWAVGEIYTADDKYNAAHWDGEKWELKKITYGGWFWTINTVFAFSHNDVWFSAFVKWNGNRVVEYPIPDVLTGYGLNKTWGTSDHDLYVVGNGGLIAHYDGQKWQRIESGTELDLTDIWGAEKQKQILAVANDLSGETLRTTILQIRNTTANKISSNPVFYPLTTLWFIPYRKYYVGGSGLYQKNFLSDGLWKNGLYDITQYYITSIRGSAINDIYAVGSYGEFLHWNGVKWKSFIYKTVLNNGAYGSISVKGNFIIAVGFNSAKAVILKAMR